MISVVFLSFLAFLQAFEQDYTLTIVLMRESRGGISTTDRFHHQNIGVGISHYHIFYFLFVSVIIGQP